MPVDISKIPTSTKRTESPITPVTEDYDSLWGFYTFSQTVQYEYNDAGKTGLSYATITINGFFTVNAEYKGSIPVGTTDKDKSDKLFAKYGALRKKLLGVIGKKQPSKLSDIGTEKDDRCVELPGKLKNNMNKHIYAIPTAFSTTEISPEILRYTVTLVEPKKVSCKLAIGNDIINDASLTIICRKPRITYRNFAFANGSEAYITGIDNRRYTLSGAICGSNDDLEYNDFIKITSSNSSSDNGDSNSISIGMSEDTVNTISDIINRDKVVVKIQKTSDDEPESAFAMIITSHNVGHVFDGGMTTIDISGEECSDSSSNSSSGSSSDS